jgi:hypothetical protein
MTGCREFFSDLNANVHGYVKFGDSSGMDTRGIRSVILVAKNDEHQLLTEVFYIPVVRNSIISLGRLDANGSRVEIKDGVMHIWDRQQLLLSKEARGSNFLYILYAKVEQPLCLAACRDDEAWRWNEHFGHLHSEALRQLGTKRMMRGMPNVDHVCRRQP